MIDSRHRARSPSTASASCKLVAQTRPWKVDKQLTRRTHGRLHLLCGIQPIYKARLTNANTQVSAAAAIEIRPRWDAQAEKQATVR